MNGKVKNTSKQVVFMSKSNSKVYKILESNKTALHDPIFQSQIIIPVIKP